MKTIGLIANSDKPSAVAAVRTVLKLAARRKVRVMLSEETAMVLGARDFVTIARLARECDLILVLGGDGTMLSSARVLYGARRPILGINFGGLGFLTAGASSKLVPVLRQVFSGKYRISQRHLIQAEVTRGGRRIFSSLALNEAVISRGEVPRIIKINLCVDGEEVTTYACDGLLVATPTGSTAYAMSAGGPVVAPDAAVFSVTPICPHTLTNRSLVVSNRSILQARIESVNRKINLTLDGQEVFSLESGDSVRLRLARKTVRLAKLDDYSFYQVLRHKLKWSGSNI
ncbi:MAG: NAD(+)/NADH kinase [Verrucomicrobiae bacterium]|nr:NAD(+)/NADH kinase [Verrucomicrobiae bacterium]